MITTEKTSQDKIHLFDSPLQVERMKRLAEEGFKKFSLITHATRQFYQLFFLLFSLELVSLLVLSCLSKSLFIAVCLAGLALTGFSFFLLRFYFEAKKPGQLSKIQRSYVASLTDGMGRDDPLFLAKALHHFAGMIDLKQWTSSSFSSLQPFIDKCLTWIHWKEIHQMKELLLCEAISFNVEMVKKEPVDLQTHAELAGAYLALAKLYRADENWVWAPALYSSAMMEEKYEECTERAVQEFKILDSLAPNDPWVHARLAAIYHDLKMPKKEIEEYEILLKITPHDRELLFRLGILYFQQKESAKALLLYDQLKKARDPKADELILYYSSAPLTTLL